MYFWTYINLHAAILLFLLRELIEPVRHLLAELGHETLDQFRLLLAQPIVLLAY